MSDYRRYFVPGGTYFFTLVTYDRQKILTTDIGRTLLRNAIEQVRITFPFSILATVLLPDHWHLVMQLPAGDNNFSSRIRRIKEEFTTFWQLKRMPECAVTESQSKRRERGIWQARFWEHCVRDEDDLTRCVDYIHWNPRKHELVSKVSDWPWSSFHRFVKAENYDEDWGGTLPNSIGTQVKTSWGE